MIVLAKIMEHVTTILKTLHVLALLNLQDKTVKVCLLRTFLEVQYVNIGLLDDIDFNVNHFIHLNTKM